MRSFLAAWTVIWCIGAAADSLPPHDPVPGGLAVIAVESTDNPRPEVHFGLKRVMVLESDDYWHAVIGLPASILPGEYLVRINSVDSEEATISFRVRPPLPGSLSGDALRRDLDTITFPGTDAFDTTFTVWRDTESVDLDFRIPVGASPNDTRPVSASPDLVDVLVQAPSGGIVSGVVPLKEQVSAVILDHGQGLFSILSPLRRVRVAPGAVLAKGAEIGGGGSNDTPARSLDWQVVMNRVRIDPRRLLTKPFTASLPAHW